MADRSVLPKLKAARGYHPPIRDVILSSAQSKQFAGHPDAEGSQLKSFESFKQAYAFLTRDDRCERALVTKAEILQRKGDELLAARLMDRLLEENPELTSARILRARYFLSNGHPELSEKDSSSQC